MSVANATSGGTAHVLPAERAKCSFDIEVMTDLVTGGGKRKERAKGFEHLFDRLPFNDTHLDEFRSYQELAEKKHERAAAAMGVVRDNPKFMLAHQGGKVSMGQFLSSSGISIHFSMFLTFVRTQADKAQQAAWLDHAVNGRFLGAYAQTELGHGSNIRALETTATFDRETDEFVVHSPTLTSMKWWPTGIQACTHAALMAQLVIDGVSYGFHGFFVQLRDDCGHCMPGVEVGEIGPKFDQAHNYIGYARFTHVRIPRFNMFAKSQQVTREGVYVPAPPKLSKFKYISMMSTRVAFVGMSGDSAAKSATIAARYLSVRAQGFTDTTAEDPLALGEHRVMDYRMTQHRVLRATGLAYMFHFTARWVGDYLTRVQREVSEGNESAADELPELHASCAGLKVWSTLYAHEAMEDMRRACGGQGFLRSSALGDIVTEFGVAVTGEGEQVILSMQVARYLIKAAQEQRAGKPLAGTVRYLEGEASKPELCLSSSVEAPRRLEALVEMYKDRARRFTLDLEARFTAARDRGGSFDEALNSVAVRAYKASETHCIYVFVRNFKQAIDEYVKDEACAAALRRLAELVFLQIMRDQAGDWIESLDYARLGALEDRIEELLTELRPDCVGLTDSFGHSDMALKDSTLGRFDGNVYEAIYERAKRSPLNEDGKQMVAWDHFSKVLDLDFLRSGMETQRVLPTDVDAVGFVHQAQGSSGVAPVAVASKL